MAYRSLFDVKHPLFNPLWRRVALFIGLVAWTGFEIWNGTYGWAVIFGALSLMVGYQFFVTWEPQPPRGGATANIDGEADE